MKNFLLIAVLLFCVNTLHAIDYSSYTYIVFFETSAVTESQVNAIASAASKNQQHGFQISSFVYDVNCGYGQAIITVTTKNAFNILKTAIRDATVHLERISWWDPFTRNVVNTCTGCESIIGYECESVNYDKYTVLISSK